MIFVSDPPLGCPTATCSWVCKVFRQLSSCGLGEQGRQSFRTIPVGVLSRRVTISHRVYLSDVLLPHVRHGARVSLLVTDKTWLPTDEE